jgi:hypothetical protein
MIYFLFNSRHNPGNWLSFPADPYWTNSEVSKYYVGCRNNVPNAANCRKNYFAQENLLDAAGEQAAEPDDAIKLVLLNSFLTLVLLHFGHEIDSVSDPKTIFSKDLLHTSHSYS